MAKLSHSGVTRARGCETAHILTTTIFEAKLGADNGQGIEISLDTPWYVPQPMACRPICRCIAGEGNGAPRPTGWEGEGCRSARPEPASLAQTPSPALRVEGACAPGTVRIRGTPAKITPGRGQPADDAEFVRLPTEDIDVPAVLLETIRVEIRAHQCFRLFQLGSETKETRRGNGAVRLRDKIIQQINELVRLRASHLSRPIHRGA